MVQIPNQFHFIFGLKPQDEPFHLVYYLCLESCRKVMRPERIHFYYHHQPYGRWWDKIKDHLELHPVELESFVTHHPGYTNHPEGRHIKQKRLDFAHQADFLRLKVLYEHGGIYADIDTIFVNPYPPELFNETCVLGEELPMERFDEKGRMTTRSLCNALIMAAKGSPFIKTWLEQSYKVFNGSWDRHSCHEATLLARRHPEQVRVVPERYFYPFRYTSKGLKRLFVQNDVKPTELFSVHMANHLWWEPRQTDYAFVNANTLTDAYLRSVDTNFNRMVRGYLPVQKINAVLPKKIGSDLPGHYANNAIATKQKVAKQYKLGLVLTTYDRPEQLQDALSSLKESPLSEAIVVIVDESLAKTRLRYQRIKGFHCYRDVDLRCHSGEYAAGSPAVLANLARPQKAAVGFSSDGKVLQRIVYLGRFDDFRGNLYIKPEHDIYSYPEQSQDRIAVRELVDRFTHPHAPVIKLYKTDHQGMFHSLRDGFDLLSHRFQCDLLVNLDSDVLVKPDWLKQLKRRYDQISLQKKPILLSGFNTGNHPIIERRNGYALKASLGGINLLFNRDTYHSLVRPCLTDLFWDIRLATICKARSVTMAATAPSVVQHSGHKGTWSNPNAYDSAADFN